MTQFLRTLRDYAILYISLAIFAGIFLPWSLVAVPLYFLLPYRVGSAIGRLALSRGCNVYARWLTLVGAYRLDLTAIDVLRDGPAVILAPNHPSMIDAILILSRHPNVVCVMKSNLTKNVLIGPGARLARYIKDRPPLRMMHDSVAELRGGSVLLLFPEGTRTTQSPVNKFTARVGLIAKRARVPVQTLIVETDSPFLGKGWSPFRRPLLPIKYRVRLGKRFDSPDDDRSFDRALEAYFRHELSESLQQNGWLDALNIQRQPE
jgi:1-acyl-sn-glycerol-3-phosphate acyltransferase